MNWTHTLFLLTVYECVCVFLRIVQLGSTQHHLKYYPNKQQLIKKREREKETERKRAAKKYHDRWWKYTRNDWSQIVLCHLLRKCSLTLLLLSHERVKDTHNLMLFSSLRIIVPIRYNWTYATLIYTQSYAHVVKTRSSKCERYEVMYCSLEWHIPPFECCCLCEKTHSSLFSSMSLCSYINYIRMCVWYTNSLKFFINFA